MVALPLIFNPTPEEAAAILADLDDPSLSFDDLAKKHGTTTDALALWLSTDPVKDQIQTTLDSMALRVRRLATSRLPAAVAAISRIVDSYGDLRRRDLSERSSVDPASPAYLADLERRRRRDESTRRACALLLRLANFFSPLKPPSPRSPGRRSAVAERGPEGRRVEDPPWRGDRGGEGSEYSPPSMTRDLYTVNGQSDTATVRDRLSEVGRRADRNLVAVATEPCEPRGTATVRERPLATNGAATVTERTTTSGATPKTNGAATRFSPSAPSPRRPPSAFNSSPTTPATAINGVRERTFGSSTFSVPSLSLQDLIPTTPRVPLGPRAPALLLARAGACTGAAP